MIFAYLDANSGSLLVSALAAGFAGIAVVLKFAWRRVRHPLRSSSERSQIHGEE